MVSSALAAVASAAVNASQTAARTSAVGLSTADYALIISLFSTALALASFVWSVWQKFIDPKARLRVKFHVTVIMNLDRSEPPWPAYVALSVTNHGPGEVSIQTVGISIRGRWPWSRPQHALVNPISSLMTPTAPSGPFGGGLPRTLKVGETHNLFFPHDAQSFGRARLGRVGVFDNFDRFHRVPKRQMRDVRASLDKAFADQPYAGPDAEVTVTAAPAASIEDVDDLDYFGGDDCCTGP